MTTHTPTTYSYEGRRHARLTKPMKDLPPTLLKVLTELRYTLRDGESAVLSCATLSRRTGICKSRVAVALRQLAGETVTFISNGRDLPYPGVGPFIQRTLQDGGGFVITMLPPGYQRRTQPPAEASFEAPSADEPSADQLPLWPDDPAGGVHEHAPLPETSDVAPECSEVPQTGVHAHVPPILLYTCNKQQQQQGQPEAENEQPESEQDAPGSQLYADLLALSGRADWSQAIASRRDITSIAQIQGQIAIARDMGKTSPQGWILKRLADGGALLMPRVPQPQPRQQPRQQQPRTSAKPMGSPYGRPTKEAIELNNRCWKRMLEIKPADADDLEECDIADFLIAGLSDAEALARAATRRKERADDNR